MTLMERLKSLSGGDDCLIRLALVEIESLRQQLAEARSHPTIEACRQMIEAQAVKENEELRQQLAEALAACKTKDELIEKFRRAIGDHHAPNDCYATGPLTGNDFLDLVQCPACSALAAYEETLADTEEKRADLEFVWNGCEHELENCKAERDKLRQQLAAPLGEGGA